MSRVRQIQEKVAAAFEVHMADLRSHYRAPRFVRARHASMYLIRKLLGYSLPEIAVEFDCDYKSARHAVLKFERNETLRNSLYEIEAACRAEGLFVKGCIQWGAIQDASGRTEQLSLPLGL